MPQVPVAYTQFHRFGIAKKCSQVAICFTTVLLQFEFKRQRVCNYEILREKKTYWEIPNGYFCRHMKGIQNVEHFLSLALHNTEHKNT